MVELNILAVSMTLPYGPHAPGVDRDIETYVHELKGA
jgi:hypothetical protein